ncbi:hypothetical protein J6590_018530 [Homalodisca vitripennis]|nr:hypothetical protein J6590_018530 [Homalodisca vitripennis]
MDVLVLEMRKTSEYIDNCELVAYVNQAASAGMFTESKHYWFNRTINLDLQMSIVTPQHFTDCWWKWLANY